MADKTSKKERDKRAAMMRRLGLDIPELVKTAFSVKGEGRNRRAEYKMFWEQVQDDQKQATLFLADVLEKLMQMLEKAPPQFGVGLESVVNTISFITLNLDFDAKDARLQKALQAWKKKEKEPDYCRKYPPAKEVVRTLSMKTEKEDITGSLLISCSTMHSVDEYQKLADVAQFPTLDPSDTRPGDSTFIYPYLKRITTEEKIGAAKLAAVLQNTVLKMVSLPQQMKMNPKVAETTLLSLLHMLRNFMSLAPVTDRAFLLKSIQTVQQFYLWPCPYGNVARDTLVLLQRELLGPGSAMRARLLSEAKKGFVRGFAAEDGQEARPAYFIVDSDDKRALAFPTTMEIINLEEKSEKKKQTKNDPGSQSISAATKLLLIGSMLKQDLPAIDLVKDDDLTALRSCSDADIQGVWEKMQQTVDSIPPASKPDVAQEIRKKAFSEFKGQWKGLAAALAKDGKKKPASIPKSFDPASDVALPPVVHFNVPSKCSYQIPTKEQVSLMCLDRTPFPTTPVLDMLKQILAEHDPLRNDQKTTELRICIVGGDRMLHNFLCAVLYVKLIEEELLKNINLKFYLLPAQRNHVAAFLARHDSWYNRHVYLPFRSVFLLPWLDCDADSSVVDQEAVDLPPPGVFYRKLTEDYLRESETAFNFNVYKIEGWLGASAGPAAGAAGPAGGAGAAGGGGRSVKMDEKMMAAIKRQEEEDAKAEAAAAAAAGKGKDGKSAAGAGAGAGDDKDTKANGSAPLTEEERFGHDQMIPFIQRFELGIIAHSERVRDQSKGKTPEYTKPDDVVKDKNIPPFNPGDVRVRFTPVDMTGRAGPVVEDDATAYQSLVVSSVPRNYDRCFPPDPSQPWLEVFAQPARPVKAKSELKRNVLLTDARQHVSMIEITAAADNQRFDIVVDGQLFGPYHRVRITPHVDDKTKKQVVFPVQTFFPVAM